MAPRVVKLRDTTESVAEAESTKVEPTKIEPTKVEPANSQRKRAEAGRYLLQVDRQTKGSYETAESAEAAGRKIKTGHPVVQVSIYDSVECHNTLVELPAAAG
jgi:hypothetical protein